MAVFAEGRFTHVDGFTLGGQHITMDIARGLTTTIADAERLKTLFGAALSGPSDDRDMLTLTAVDDDPRDPPRLIPRAQLVRIIRPRVEEILEMVRDKLAASPFAADPRGRVILVGGATRMPQVRNRIVAEFNVDPELFDPDEAVAKGAALYALKESLLDQDVYIRGVRVCVLLAEKTDSSHVLLAAKN